MSNVIFLSSSPAVSGAREPLTLGRSPSPDFPTLEELVSQENNANARPTRAHAKNAQSKSTGGTQHNGHGKRQSTGAVDGPPEVDGSCASAVDVSRADTPPPGLATAPPTKTTTHLKKPPASRKVSRATSSGIATTRGTSANEPPQANTTDDIAAPNHPKPTKPRRKQTGAVSQHFKTQHEPARSKTPTEIPDEPLNIETALNRRGDWTPPPKDTVREFGSRSSDIIELLSSTSKEQGAGNNSKDIFQSLKETYGYELEEGMLPAPEPGDTQAVFKKRKLIEMVSTSNGANVMAPPPPPEKSPTKRKAPKKKARTITGLATAAYEAKEPELPPLAPSDPPAAKPSGAAVPGKKPRAKTKRKPKAPKKDDPRMVLYSPEAALKQVAQQDFVFGTSSQLVREEERGEEDLLQLKDSMSVIEEEYFTPVNSDAIEPPEAQPKLWNAAARDADGELLHLEVIDLVNDSPGGEAHSDDDPFGYVNPERSSERPTNTSDKSLASPLALKSTNTSARAPLLKTASQGSSLKHPDSSAGATHDRILGVMSFTSPPPSSQKRISRIYEAAPDPTAQPSPSPTKSGYTAPEKPRFELYTDAQLARQVAAYGFKPIKKRAGMIGLLDECWSSKYQRKGARAYSTSSSSAAVTDAAEVTVETTPLEPVVEPVKRPRGRPRKNASPVAVPRVSAGTAIDPVPEKRPRGRPRKTAAPASPKKAPVQTRPSTRPKKSLVLEIPDSDTEPPSSPELIFSSPPLHDITLDEPLALAPTTGEESTLHTYITRAVTSAPRSDDPGEPSWHEKMLMYESVIVEDLAAWLNTGPLDGVGFDGEVSAGEVKGWCEANSVCCVWRTRVGGGTRKRL